MTIDDAEPTEKEMELIEQFAKACASIGASMDPTKARSFVEHFASVNPPSLTGRLSTTIEMTQITPGGRSGGISIKPGNILLNMRKLIVALSGGVLTVVGIATGPAAPWFAVFGAIVVWDSLHSLVRQKLTETDASVLWTLWLHADKQQQVPDAGLLEHVNAERQKYGRAPMTKDDLNDSLKRLEDIRTIKHASEDPSNWFLREYVRVDY